MGSWRRSLFAPDRSSWILADLARRMMAGLRAVSAMIVEMERWPENPVADRECRVVCVVVMKNTGGSIFKSPYRIRRTGQNLQILPDLCVIKEAGKSGVSLH
jgi:hypothetical protein